MMSQHQEIKHINMSNDLLFIRNDNTKENGIIGDTLAWKKLQTPEQWNGFPPDPTNSISRPFAGMHSERH